MKLTPEQRKIVHLVSQGKTNKEIAGMIHLSPHSIRWNLSKIFKAANVKNRVELAALYMAMKVSKF